MFLNGFNPPPSLILRFNGRRGKASKQAPVLPPTTKSSLYVEMFLFRETEKFGMNGMVNILVFKNSRVSCTSVATAGSSASRMESPNPSSSSARTLAGYPGLSSTVASTRRVSLKSVPPAPFIFEFSQWMVSGEEEDIDAHVWIWILRMHN